MPGPKIWGGSGGGGAGGLFTEDSNDNVVGGDNAGSEISSGTENIYAGDSAGKFGDGSYNIKLGIDAGLGVTGNDNIENVIIGYQAGKSITTGSSAVIIGFQAGITFTTGGFGGRHYSVYIGYYSGRYVDTGAYNVCVGGYSGHGVDGQTTFAASVFVGYGVANGVTTGDNNVGVGYRSLDALTSADGSVVVGYQAGNSISTGDYNTCIGYNADVSSGSITNGMALGNGTSVDANNKVVIGNSSVSTIGGYANWSNYSDEKIKLDVKDCKLGLDFVMALRPRTFRFENKDGIYEGLIAQEVKSVMDHQYVDFSGWIAAGENELQMLSYEKFVIPLINAVQELNEKVDTLYKKIAGLST